MLSEKRCGIFLIICFLFMALFLFADKCVAVTPPWWIQAHANGSFNNPKVYHGIGFSEYKNAVPNFDELRLAKDRALDDLCYQFSVSIEADFKDQVVHVGNFEEQRIVSSLFITTRNVLSGVQEKEKWTDQRRRRHWVLLAIDKESADKQIEQQKFINEVVDRLEHKQDEVLEGIKQMASVLNNTMQVYKDRMNQFETLLQTIDSKVEASGAEIKDEYAFLRQEILRLESTRKAYENRLADSEKRQSEQIESLIFQNSELKKMISQLSEKIQGDYFLALADDDIKYKDVDTDFRVSIKPDKGQGADYYADENVRFMIHASRGCYLKVIYLSSRDEHSRKEKKINTLLFPNVHDKDNRIDPGETKIIGKHGELIIEPPFGMDIVTVVASENQFSDLEDIFSNSRGGYYSEETSNVNDTLQIRTRGIGVAKYGSSSVSVIQKPLSVATDTCFIVSHPVP